MHLLFNGQWLVVSMSFRGVGTLADDVGIPFLLKLE